MAAELPPLVPPGAFPPAPVECPNCHRVAAVAITRGFPSPRMNDAIERGQVEHRGCLVGPDDDNWSCRACGYEWRDEPDESLLWKS